MARLVPMDAAPRKPRELGALAGEIGPIPDDFDDPLPEDELALFHGPLFPEEL
jgi:hypothetical protein